MKSRVFQVVIGLLIVGTASSVRAEDKENDLSAVIARELVKALTAGDEDGGKISEKNERGRQAYEPEADAGFSFEPFNETGRSLFPSLLLATATMKEEPSETESAGEDPTEYGDKMSPFGVLIRNVRKGDKITLEISSGSLIKPSSLSFAAADSERLVKAAPKLRFDYEALAKADQAVPVSVDFKLTRNGEAAQEVTHTWTLRSINDCPFVGRVPVPKRNGTVETEIVDLKFMFAAYVNENHPWVDQILKAAKSTGMTNSFLGYQGTEQDVLQQVAAVWEAFKMQGITYSSITDTVPSKEMFIQHVRLLDESITATQANCVDGSVMMASVLKKIGIKTYLVLVPGHCYLAFSSTDPDQGQEKILGVETTMLGSGVGLAEAIYQATTQAEHSLEKSWDKFQVEEEMQYQLIDLNLAREAGIMPLPYRKSKRGD